MTQRADPGLGLKISDEDLMRRVQVGDILAFEEIYNRYSARAFGLARLICHDSHRAEEAAQDGFVAVWGSRGSYDPARGSVRGWLLTLIRHCSIDVMRRVQRDDGVRDSEGELDFLSARDSVAEDAEAHDEASRVRESVRALPDLQREVIALAFFGGLTHTEIAARLRLPTGTVKGRMRLGLHKVRTEINCSSSDQLGPRPALLRRN